MTTLIHGEGMSDQATLFSKALFSHSSDIIDLSGINFDRLLDSSRLRTISRTKFEDKNVSIFQFLKQVFPEYSNNQTRNMIRSGGIRLNHEKVDDFNFTLSKDLLKDHVLVNHGKTSFFIVKIES